MNQEREFTEETETDAKKKRQNFAKRFYLRCLLLPLRTEQAFE